MDPLVQRLYAFRAVQVQISKLDDLGRNVTRLRGERLAHEHGSDDQCRAKATGNHLGGN
jgi:hypothetical protein